MSHLSKRVTKRWLSSQGVSLLQVNVPKGCQSFFAKEVHLPEILKMSRVAFGDTALKPYALKRYLGVAHSTILCLGAAGQIVGYCVAEFNLRQRRVYVVETCIEPSFKGRGYGSWLRGRVEALAVARRYLSISSHVRIDNHAAFALNQKCGMKVFKRLLDYYEDGSEAFYLRKKL